MIKRIVVYLFPFLFPAIRLWNFFAVTQFQNQLHSKLVESGFLSEVPWQERAQEAYLVVKTGFAKYWGLYLTTLVLQALTFIFLAFLVCFFNKKQTILKTRNRIALTGLCYILGLALGFLLFMGGIFLLGDAEDFALPLPKYPEWAMLIPLYSLLSTLSILNGAYLGGLLGISLEIYTVYVIWCILGENRLFNKPRYISNYERKIAPHSKAEWGRKRDYILVALFMIWVWFIYTEATHGGFISITQRIEDSSRRVLNLNTEFDTDFADTREWNEYWRNIIEEKRKAGWTNEKILDELTLNPTGWKVRNRFAKEDMEYLENLKEDGYLRYYIYLGLNVVIALFMGWLVIDTVRRILRLNDKKRDIVYLKLGLMCIWWYLLFFIPHGKYRDTIIEAIDHTQYIDFQRMIFELAIICVVIGSFLIWRKLGREIKGE